MMSELILVSEVFIMVSTCNFSWFPLFERVAVYWLFAHVLILPYIPASYFPKESYYAKIFVICQNLCSAQGQRPQGHRKAAGFVCSCMVVLQDFLARLRTIAPLAQISRRLDLDKSLQFLVCWDFSRILADFATKKERTMPLFFY